MKKKLSLLMVALVAITAFAMQFTRRTAELVAVSEATTWDFSQLASNTESALYNSKDDGIKLDNTTTPSQTDEVVYSDAAAYITANEGFNTAAIAFKGQYPIRKNKYCQNGELHFKAGVAGKIVVSFNDTGSTPSATAVKRYLVVNDKQTEYWSSRENNGTEPYAAQLNVTSGEIEVAAGDVTITGSSAIQVSKIVFTPNATPEPAAEQITSTYVFTSAKWNATLNDVAANWTSGKDGGGFSNNGVQVTTNFSGAYATSPDEFDNISKIVVTYNTNKSSGAGTLDIKIGDNEKTTKDWAYSTGDGRTANYTIEYDYATPQSGAVTLTASTTTNSIYVVSIAITHDKPVPPAVAKPVIAGETPFLGTTNVTITCATEGAAIYYTTDGTAPTTESTAYTEPFAINATTTVKAIAVKDADQSEVAEKTFTAMEGTATLAELNALEKDATFGYTGEALVVAKPTAKYVYVTDASGAALIYDATGEKTTAAEVGKTIAANWTGKVSIFNQLTELVPDAALVMKDGDAVAVEYPEVAAADMIAENVNRVVTLKGITGYTVDGKNMNITIGETNVVGYNQFGLEIAAAEKGRTYEMVGAIGRHNETIQFLPISIIRTPEVVDVTVDAADITGDITAALNAKTTAITEAGDIVGNITINLEAGDYTVSAPIVAGGNVVINGNGATIDASTLTGDNAIIKLPAGVSDMTNFGQIAFNNVNMKIATRLVYANKSKFWIEKIAVDNCVISVDGTFKKSIFDCNGGGNVKLLSVNNSTIYADPKIGQNGGFFSSQSSQKPTEFGDKETQTFQITNSTLYNITNGNNMVTLRENNKAYLNFIFKNNVIVNCGKNKEFFKGFGSGNLCASSTWDVDGNIVNFGGVDTSADDLCGGDVKNPIAGVVTFTDAANGDFNGTCGITWGAEMPTSQVGDPRWKFTYSQKGIMEDGKYFIQSLPFDDPQQWLGAGKLSDFGVEFTATFNAETLTYTLQTADGKYLQSDLTFGETAFGWTIDDDASLGVNIYTKDGDTKKYIGVNEEKNLVLTETATDPTIGWGPWPADAFWAMLAPRVIVGSTELTGTAEAYQADIKNAMTKNELTGLWEKTFKLVEVTAEKQPEFKVALNGDATKVYPAEARKITLADFGAEAQPGIYNITITYNDEGNVVGVSGVKVEPEDIVINPSDLGKVYGVMNEALEAALDGKLAKSITFNLGEGINYFVTKSITTAVPLTINGATGATIDASTLTGDNAIIKLPAGVSDMTNFGQIAFNNVNMKIATRLVYANKSKFWIEKIAVDNCVISVDGTFKKSIFDCNGGGNVKLLSVNNSTIYADPKIGQNGGFFSSQSSQKPTEFGDKETQTFQITNSTLYNITNGNNMVTLRENNKAYLNFIFKNNVIVNCGKNKEFFKGFGSGNLCASSTWDVDGNIVNFGGVDTSADDLCGGEIKNPVKGVITFADAANGNFNGNVELPFGAEAPATQPGDTEWILTYTNAPQLFAINKAEATNGSFVVKIDDAEVTEAAAETTVAIIATPAENYEVETVTVKGVTSNEEVAVTPILGQDNAYQFNMPADAVMVTVTFKYTTGINGVKADALKDAQIYNLQGVRVDKAQKGLYIVNGKKVVIK